MNEVVSAVMQDVLSVVGVPTGTLGVMYRTVAEERSRRISVALSRAEQLTGMTREQIDDHVREDPESVPLLVRVLQAAGNTGNDRTLRILGAALGRVIEDERSRPERELLVMTIEGLTEEQLVVLAACSEDPACTEEVSAKVSGEVDVNVVEMALMSLIPRGVFSNPFGYYGGVAMWKLSTLGIAVKEAALAAYPHPFQED